MDKDEDQKTVFIAVNAQIVVFVHIMRAFGLLEEDVRLWIQFFVNSSMQMHKQISQQQISMFYEQVESVFCSADEEENDLPLHTRNKLVRVLPNMSGYQCCYVDEGRLQKVELPEDPLFNSEQEKLLHELTTLMSENVEMKLSEHKTVQSDKFSLPRNELIQELWTEGT